MIAPTVTTFLKQTNKQKISSEISSVTVVRLN